MVVSGTTMDASESVLLTPEVIEMVDDFGMASSIIELLV